MDAKAVEGGPARGRHEVGHSQEATSGHWPSGIRERCNAWQSIRHQGAHSRRCSAAADGSGVWTLSNMRMRAIGMLAQAFRGREGSRMGQHGHLAGVPAVSTLLDPRASGKT